MASARYTPWTMWIEAYVDAAAADILVQALLLIAVVALALWLLGRARRRR